MVARKKDLNDRQFGALKLVNYTTYFSQGERGKVFAGNVNKDDYPVSYTTRATVNNTRTLIKEITTPDGFMSIVERFNITRILQAGQAQKEVVFEVVVQPNQDGWPEVSAGEWSVLTTAGPQERECLIAPALVGGSTIKVYGEAVQGAAVDVTVELVVLQIGE